MCLSFVFLILLCFGTKYLVIFIGEKYAAAIRWYFAFVCYFDF